MGGLFLFFRRWLNSTLGSLFIRTFQLMQETCKINKKGVISQLQEDIRKMLEHKGIHVSEERLEPLVLQWRSFQQLKSKLKSANLSDNNIGLIHVPGGEQNEQ